MKNKKFYAVLIAIALCLVFKISANLSGDSLKDFFNVLAVSIPGSIITFTALTNKEQNKESKFVKKTRTGETKMREKKDKIKTIISILIISYAILCILADVSIINFDIELYIPSTYVIIYSATFLSFTGKRNKKGKQTSNDDYQRKNKIMQFLQGLVEGILVTAVLIHLVAWLVLGKTVDVFSSNFYPTLFITLYFLMKVYKTKKED
ncbi:hypothetical protein [Streptococcus suis]|uniref:hypothetical protein n=1 Tax=Streptococcus suis TaxID=1307 RepID=UPI000CF3A713|nr:hypothetical protein [Streptococcus suis]